MLINLLTVALNCVGEISDATAAPVLQAAGYSQTKTNCQIVVANQIKFIYDQIQFLNKKLVLKCQMKV